jgi:hypothetical protein
MGPAVLPALAVAFPFEAGPVDVRARLSLSLTPFSEDVTATGGTAAVTQQLVVADAAIPLVQPSATLVPLVTAGAGIHHLRAEGTALPPHAARNDGAWALATSAGAMLAVTLDTRLAVLAEAHAVFVLPEPVVAIADEAAGRLGIPVLLLRLGIVAGL